jgi:hypothetical protein
VKYNKKEDAPLISPATYVTDENAEHFPDSVKESNKAGTAKPWYHRKNKNVVEWSGWVAIDVDDWKPENDDWLNDLKRNFESYSCIVYSTASHSNDSPKFRVVFEVSRAIRREEIKSLWYALSVEFEKYGVDPQCKDLSRMYYVPADYGSTVDGGFIFSCDNGSSLNVDALLKKPPAPKPKSNNFLDNHPPDVQKEVIEHRKKQLENTDISWTSYRNCPFWPRKMAQEYLFITDTGWYHKMYQMMIAIASQAIKKKYPITPIEIAQLCFEFDMENGGWYKDRALEEEANRALEYVYRNM